MRSRPKTTVFLSPKTILPGQRMKAEIRMLSTGDTPVDWISAHLECVLETSVRQGNSRATHTAKLYEATWRSKPLTLTPGEHEFRVGFDLPPNAPASYKGTDASILWSLTVHVSIPWWPDLVRRYDVPVAFLESPPLVPVPHTYATSREGPRGMATFMELALDSTQLSVGDVLAGSISLSNLRGRRVRGIDVSFVSVESVELPRFDVREARRFTLRVLDGAPAEGQAVPFRVRVPDGATPTFRVGALSVSTHLEVRADVAWGEDVVVRPPLHLAPRSGAPRLTNAWVAPVGQERRARVWQAVASRTGLVFDPESDSLRGTFSGATLEVRNEQRAADSWLVAVLVWPTLGLDLDVTERTWTDALAMNVVKSGDELIDARFAAHAREHPQASAIVKRELLGALAGFEEARLEDKGATVAIRGTAHANERVEAFVRAALDLAGRVEAARVRVPAPLLFARDVAAWQAFAERYGGRLELGRMWIHDGRVGHDRFELGATWARAGALLGTTIRVFVDPRLGAVPRSPDDPTVSPAARAAWKALRASTKSVFVAPEEIVIELEGRLADPQTAVPALENGVALRRALAGVTAAGPFR